MPQLTFENLDASLSRLPALIQSIPDVIRNPAANPLQAVILLGIFLALALIVVVSVALILIRPSAEEEALLSEEELEEVAPPTEEEQAELSRATTARRFGSALTVISIIILVGVAGWLVLGITTYQSQFCASCHPNTSHLAAKAEDPHADVACVECHEGGGQFARISVNVLTRAQHVVLARLNPDSAAAFGKPVASDACLRCHRQQIAGTYYDPKRKVKVVHSDPLAAGAECVDCHVLASGVLSAVTVGMSPCLRCHDGKKAKAECSACHVGDPSQAIRPNIAPTDMATAQVPNPQCGGCHKDMTKCNACHGLPMPHSDAFMAYLHARPAAVAIWNNNLKLCRKCHYRGHNDCQQSGCHIGNFPSHPSPAWRSLHGTASWSQSNIRCACHQWNPYDHNGLNFCQICHPVKPKGAIP